MPAAGATGQLPRSRWGYTGARRSLRRIPLVYAVEEISDLSIINITKQEIVGHQVGDNRVLLPLLGGARVPGVALCEPSQILQQPVPVQRSPFLRVLPDRSIAGLWGVGCEEGGNR
jgi:hypothetical protein